MKEISGGQENSDFYCFYYTNGVLHGVWANAANSEAAQSACDTACWSDANCTNCDCLNTAFDPHS
jgi:hypothetical protein